MSTFSASPTARRLPEEQSPLDWDDLFPWWFILLVMVQVFVIYLIELTGPRTTDRCRFAERL